MPREFLLSPERERSATGFLGPDDPAAFEIVNPQGRASVVLLCDHASNRVPKALGTLGLPRRELERHIAWDIGIAAVTRRLAPALDAPAVLSGYSRLVIDCNRDVKDEQSIPESSDGTDVPGNRNLAEHEIDDRIRFCYEPYHDTASRLIEGAEARGRPPVVVFMHSFTPFMNGQARPWHVGVLWERDGRMALPAMDFLNKRGDLVVGDNEPYSALEPRGYSLPFHASRAGRPTMQFEIRQDLISHDNGVEDWAVIIEDVLQPLLADDTLYQRLS